MNTNKHEWGGVRKLKRTKEDADERGWGEGREEVEN
jgi:hypothetical protein